MMEQAPCRWEKGLNENHWSNGGRSKRFVLVVECFRSTPALTCEKTLMIPGHLAVAVEPLCEIGEGVLELSSVRWSDDG